MDKKAPIYVAGHRGLVGSALVRALRAMGHSNLLLRTHSELDLECYTATDRFFEREKPKIVLLAAGRVGGIQANNTFPAEFIASNLAIELNVIRAAHRHGVSRLLFLGSSCIYPKLAETPISEASLLTGPLEPTNRPYALAKIAGIELCWSFNRQYGTRFLAVMPTNLYGDGDSFDLQKSHVLPALIRKFHEAKANNAPAVVVWGSGRPMREFLHSDDLASGCLHLLGLDDAAFDHLLGNSSTNQDQFTPPVVNIGAEESISIADLARMISKVVGFGGKIVFDTTQPDGTMRKTLDSTLLRSMGWKPTIDLETGLRRTYALYRSATSGINRSRLALVSSV